MAVESEAVQYVFLARFVFSLSTVSMKIITEMFSVNWLDTGVVPLVLFKEIVKEEWSGGQKCGVIRLPSQLKHAKAQKQPDESSLKMADR